MLEKPDLADDALVACVRDAYAIPVAALTFLPLGHDRDTAVYRVVAGDGTPYFLKLRRGAVNEPGIAVPRLLAYRGIAQVIAPLETRAGHLWTRIDPFTLTLYPFVAGQNGFVMPLSDCQWTELGVALRRIHATAVPPALAAQIPRETYGTYWCDRTRAFQAQVADTAYPDPVAAQLAAFLSAQRETITHLVRRAEELGAILRARPPETVLCHADLHAANVLIDAQGAFFIVDWDTLIFAPKERDLMFIGGGIGGAWNEAREAALFYRGYGPVIIDPVALAYYRYVRIVEDIAVFCEELLLTDAGGADRPRTLRAIIGAFDPGDVVEIACRSDPLRHDD